MSNVCKMKDIFDMLRPTINFKWNRILHSNEYSGSWYNMNEDDQICDVVIIFCHTGEKWQ